MQTRLLFGGPATTPVKSLIIINVTVFISQLGFLFLFKSSLLENFFGLEPREITANFALWRFFSYMFLHSAGNPFHLLFNMLPLYMFGNELVRHWGQRRFLVYYFVTGAGAGVCSWLAAMQSDSIVIGASGAIYGLLLAYGMTWPNRVVYLNFLFPVKVKWLVIIMGAVAFISSLSGTVPGRPESGVAHIAHLGGMVVGYLFLKGRDWRNRYSKFNEQRGREQLKQQFELYYGDVRRKVERDNKKDSIH